MADMPKKVKDHIMSHHANLAKESTTDSDFDKSIAIKAAPQTRLNGQKSDNAITQISWEKKQGKDHR